jgi:predicted ATPase
MKIAITGTQCIGKSTFIADFIKKWPMYRTAGNDCSSLIKEKNLKHSQESTEETQDLILNHLIDQALSCSKADHVIFDRCVLDNLAYTTWLNLKGKISDQYLKKILPIIQETIKVYDIIFISPITKVSPVEVVQNGTRDVDLVFREEIDNILKAFVDSYHRHNGKIFDPQDSPALIEIFGKPEERIQMAQFYINEKGNSFSDDESLIQIPAEFDPELIGIL